MSYINTITNQYPYSVAQLKRDNPQTSFPKNPSAAALAEFGLYPVSSTTQPSFDATTHKLVESTPAYVNGAWLQVWEVVPLTSEEITKLVSDEARVVRSQRNSLLAECDWTQLSDTQVDTAAWATYRQALRDITEQAGFPWSILWPIQPNN